ncbi:MAG: glycosyltransferase family 39 protein [Candidatus Thermoplasmatota archaeon]
MVFEGLLQWVAEIPPWVVYLVVFLGGLIEAIPFLGILVPAHTAVFLASVQWAYAGRNPLALVLLCTVGGAVGDILCFGLGRRYGLGFAASWPKLFRLTPERQAKIEALFASHGILTIVLSRTQPFVRSFTPYVAGASRFAARRFWPATLAGNLLVTSVVVLGGWLTGLGFRTLGGLLGKALVITVLGIVAFLALSFYLTKQLKVVSAGTLRLALAALGLGAAFAFVAAQVLGGGTLEVLETGRSGVALDRLSPLFQAIAEFLNSAASAPLLLTPFLVLAVRDARRRDWPAAYAALAAGPLLLGLVAIVQDAVGRLPPTGTTPFPLAGSFPHEGATLAASLAGLILWRCRAVEPIWSLLARRSLAFALALLVAALAIATGAAWPTDAVAGLLVGGLWISLVLLAQIFVQHLVAPIPDAARGLTAVRWLQKLWARVASWCDARLTGAAPLVALLGFGILVRLVAPWFWPLGPDGDRYAAMAKGLLDTGAFTMPWGDIYTPGNGPQPSHHYPPLYPTLLAGFYAVLGFGRDPTRVASIATSFAAIAVTWLCTRDLYGPRKGLIAAAVVAVSPILILTTNKGYAENLLLLLFVATMWAILKSLERPWFIVAAALFAALGYLTKSSIGYFFIIAGLGGLAWRLRFRGLKVLRDPSYLTAIALFGSVVALWAWRNWSLFGTWQTSEHISAAYSHALAHPVGFVSLLAFSFLVMFGLGYLLFMAVAPWLPQLRRIPLLANEHDSGLWLAAILPLVLTLLIDAALWQYEESFFLHNVRYVSFALIPLVWILLRHAKPSKATWFALLASFTVLVAGTLYYAVPQEKVENSLSSEWGPLVSEGDSITFVGTNDVYRFYFDVTAEGTRSITDVRVVDPVDASNVTTTWAFVRGDGAGLPASYTKVLEEMGSGTARLTETYTLWRIA